MSRCHDSRQLSLSTYAPHIYLILPSVGETNPAARRFADQLLRIHPAGS